MALLLLLPLLAHIEEKSLAAIEHSAAVCREKSSVCASDNAPFSETKKEKGVFVAAASSSFLAASLPLKEGRRRIRGGGDTIFT